MLAKSRYIVPDIKQALSKKMVLISGPRQVGKTTLAKSLMRPSDYYLNYDFPKDKRALLKQELPSLTGLVVLDEIHKMKGWRNLIKGYFDKFNPRLKIIVTGSARLEHYRKAGDSLQGRYRHFRLNPLSVKELALTSESDFLKLLTLGGFPEPYFSSSEKSARIWRGDYHSRLIRDEIGPLENFRDLSQLELLAERLPELVASPLSINSLREDLDVAHLTVKRWLQAFENTYTIFRVYPFGAANIKAVKKESKHYHYDWALVEDEGARFENLVALHLLKWVQFQQDVEGLVYELRFMRDLEEREVDLVVTHKTEPILAVECKVKSKDISKPLIYFKRKFPRCRCVQVDYRSGKQFVSRDGIEALPALVFLNEFV
ncbi:MAG: ATP-binding protein [Bdellovibrionota bacterium]